MGRFPACCHRNYLITFIRLSLILGGHLHPRLQSHPILPGNDVLLLLPLLVEENLLHLPHGWSSRCQNEINPIWYDDIMTINLVPLTFGTLWACKASRNWTGVSCIYSCHIFCRELMAFIWLIECPNVIVASHEQIHIPGKKGKDWPMSVFLLADLRPCGENPQQSCTGREKACLCVKESEIYLCPFKVYTPVLKTQFKDTSIVFSYGIVI